MQIIETIKAHPYATGAIVLGAGALFIFLTSDGDDDSGNVYDGGYMVSGPSDAQVAAGVALQSRQMDLAAQQSEIAAQLKLADITAGAAIEAEQIKASSAFNLAEMSVALQRYNIEKSAETAQHVNTLSAMVADKSLDLEYFRTEEASRNTALAIASEYDYAVYDRTLDLRETQIETKAAKKVAKKGLKVAEKLGLKQLEVQKKLGVIAGDVAITKSKNDLIGGIIGGIFGLGGKVIDKTTSLANPNVTNKTNTAAKVSVMPVEGKKDKKGKKK